MIESGLTSSGWDDCCEDEAGWEAGREVGWEVGREADWDGSETNCSESNSSSSSSPLPGRKS